MLQVLGAGTVGGLLLGRLEAQEADEPPFVLVQGDRCVPVEPLEGDEPVAELYDYTYPTDRFEGSPGSDGTTYSSEGTTDLQRDRTSILFLYDGPEGRSLVVVHGHLDGEEDEGGAVSFVIHGLPDDDEWVVRDDDYRSPDGEVEADDRWDVDDDPHVVDWGYVGGRTDGGAFRGLGPDPEVRIDPAFNEEAARWDDRSFGRIERWEVLSGDRADVDRYELDLDEPVSILPGPCPDDRAAADEPETPDDDRDSPDSEEPARVVVDADTDDNVETDGGVRVREGVELDGNVEAGGLVELEPGAEIDGNVQTASGVLLGADAEVDGNVEAGGPVELGEGAAIDGNVEAGGRVTVGRGAEIDGNVEAGGRVTVGRGAEIDGNVESRGAVTVGPDGEIDGNVTGTSVTVDDAGEVDGSITTTDG